MRFPSGSITLRHQLEQCLRCLSNCSGSRVPAFAFDIDGVLMRGSEPLPVAKEAMRALFESSSTAQYPVVFMTNGGGSTEARRAEVLSEKLDINVHPSQVILCHTTMQEMLPEYQDKAVLISGRASSLAVARSYGFRRAVSVQQLASAFGNASVPFSRLPPDQADGPCPVKEWGAGVEEAINAVLVFTDPDDWFRDLQICSDTVLSRGLPGRPFRPQGGSNVKVVFGHRDLLWANAHHSPRYGLGAFALALDALYTAAAHEPLAHKVFHGKPTCKPYRLAEKRLQQQLDDRCNASTGPRPCVGPIFMVGDNPHSDIHGANSAGEPWISVLVRTGVWQGPPGSNDPVHPAKFVVDHVLDAVRLAN